MNLFFRICLYRSLKRVFSIKVRQFRSVRMLMTEHCKLVKITGRRHASDVIGNGTVKTSLRRAMCTKRDQKFRLKAKENKQHERVP